VSAFTLAAYEPSDRPALLELMRGAGLGLDDEEFEWWFERNPTTSPRLISVARADGVVVGALGMTMFPVLAGGRERILAVPLHAATSSSHRGRGIFSGLELRNEQEAAEAGAAGAIAFPNPRSRRLLHALGWVDLRPLRIWARPLAVVPAARALARPAASREALRSRTDGGRTAGGFRVEPLRRFDSEAEAVWRRVARGNELVRDASFLNWRYVDTPREYRCFGAYDGATLAGFAVVGQAIRRGVPAGVIADLVASRNGARVALLRRCLAELASGTAALVSLVRPPERRAFLRIGFVPTHARIRVAWKALGEPGILGDREGWRFSLGDLDFF
jgi:Acetyltransferase (GNAT) domain